MSFFIAFFIFDDIYFSIIIISGTSYNHAVFREIINFIEYGIYFTEKYHM